MKFRFVLLILIFFLPAYLLFSQMPDWSFFRDRDGNPYFYDKAGNIRITSVPEYNLITVSDDGLDYYLNLGIEFCHSGDYHRGLTILKSIIAMPVKDNRVFTASANAVKTLNRLEKKHGVRFSKMNENACLLLFREKNSLYFINDRMRYSMKIPGKIDLINKRERSSGVYRYMGIKLGVNTDPADKKKSYDFIIAVDSEVFGKKIAFVKEYENYVRNRIPRERTEEKPVSSNLSALWYSFRNTNPPVAGMFGFVINGRFGYSVRILCSEKRLPAIEKDILSILNSFTTVAE